MNTVFTAVGGLLLASLPLAACFALFRIFRLIGRRWRESAMDAATCWGVLLVLITEGLSVPRLVTRPVVAAVWLVLTLALVAYGRVLRQRATSPSATPHRSRLEDPTHEASSLAPSEWALLLSIGLLAAVIALTAVLSAPNTWDSMAYHMSRVAQWMTNRDVKFYPAFYSAQLFLSPWSEYAMLQLDLLYGGDRLVNLVEWMSMIGSVIGVSLIAERLGAGRRGQIFAAVACATIPNGILEASGAMNTYVGAFWVVVAVYYLLLWNERRSWPVIFAIGASLGLAILTKGTGYMLLPCIVLACWWMGRAASRKLLLQRLPVVLLVFLALNGPLYVRNYRLSGSPLGFSTPLGDDPQRQYANSQFSPSITFANVVKNVALHVVTPSNGLNARISRTTLAALRKLGIDPNDSRSTYRGGFHFNGLSINESRVGNPMQLALIFLAFLLLFSKKVGTRDLRWYFAGLAGSFVLFCALLRWQNANGRYHLPLFVLAMALVAVALERAFPSGLVTTIAWILVISALPFMVLNSLRPLIPLRGSTILRTPWTQTYFADSHNYVSASYQSAARAALATGCGSIGVDASLDDFDYPMFAMLGAGRGDRIVRYAGVRNLTAQYARPESRPPCVVVCLRCANAAAKWAEYRNVGGRVSVFDEVAVFSMDGDIPNDRTVVLPDPAQQEEIFQQLDRYRESPPAISLAATEDHVLQAGHDWPARRNDLKDRLDGLYTGTVSLWRVRDSVDPMRKRGQPIDHSKMDPTQLLAAMEVTENWYQTEPDKIQHLNGLADQLYFSWETRLAAVPSPAPGKTNACEVQIDIKESPRNNLASNVAHSRNEDRNVSLAECTCLGSAVHSGDLLSRKSVGSYDEDAENLTQCHLADAASDGRTAGNDPNPWTPRPQGRLATATAAP